MIIINKKKYDNVSKKVSFGEYSVTQDGKKRHGKAPFISFEFNNIVLSLETIYDKEWIDELQQNDNKDVNKYISDIIYEDGNSWVSLITGNYKCFINKIENNVFVPEFSCEAEECGEFFDILINEQIRLDL